MYYNYSVLYASCVPSFGGYYGGRTYAGAFFLIVNDSATDTAAVGGRLMFL